MIDEVPVEMFEMSIEAIRERCESWRSICEEEIPGEGHVACDFWRDIEWLLVKLETEHTT